MKLYEFSVLPEEEQYNILWSFGSHVDTHISNSIVINLYVINDFFVEVYYNVKENKILCKKHFKQGELLDKYLDKIRL